ncbi:conserved phage C-terminal domain-containing protein [Dysgonomonas sp. GY75]|uniref:DUF6291 domain-containing protein n=1 Tax=Dysgonomonas sp. GY75 TaxID=2780419 RepID=UPI001883B6F6|nr:DUF6291 domain-containing protein [Dysgonomonas sp. GY75]MBF0651086.1 conserved phage C-terminal domain-containing protein [Dysgonomonas sp. GY75]
MHEDKRDSFVFYRSFFEAIDCLPDAEQLILYKAITVYSLDETEPEIQGTPAAMFKLIRPVLEANTKRWKNGKKGGGYGKKGGAPAGNKNASKKQAQNKAGTTGTEYHPDAVDHLKGNNQNNLKNNLETTYPPGCFENENIAYTANHSFPDDNNNKNKRNNPKTTPNKDKDVDKDKENNIYKDIYVDFINSFNDVKHSGYKPTVKVERQFNARIREGFTVEDMLKALRNAMATDYHKNTGFTYLTPEFFTRSDKIELYINKSDMMSDDPSQPRFM